jgi:hypothetical protein
MFRCLRATPRKFIGLRVAVFAIGMIYVLGTTTTIQSFGLAFEALAQIGKTMQQIAGTTPKLNE